MANKYKFLKSYTIDRWYWDYEFIFEVGDVIEKTKSGMWNMKPDAPDQEDSLLLMQADINKLVRNKYLEEVI